MTGFLPLVELDGPPRERGRTLGRAMADRIHATARMYADAFRKTPTELESEGLRFRDTVAGFSRSYLTEMEGIAEGAGLPLGSVLAINARSEIRPPTLATECTSVAFPASGWYGQTWDWAAAQEKLAILVRTLHSDGHRTLTMTEPGMLAKVGISSAGVSVCLNALTCYEKSRGVPVHLLLRGALDARTAREADGLVRPPRGCAGNILLGYRHRYLDVEHANERAFVLEGGRPFAHANHYLGADITRRDLPRHRSSLARQARATELLLDGPGDLPHLESILADTEGPLPILRPFGPHEEFERYGTVFRICMHPVSGVFRIAEGQADAPHRELTL
ncbi:MAG: C45 family autoproteolytic acyltransferase/hydrolase, partial [Longimicrobiales bacterium]